MPQIPQTIICTYPRTPLWRWRSVFRRAVSGSNMCQVVFAVVARADLRLRSTLGRAGLALRRELSIQPLKHGVGTVIGTEPQYPAPRVFDHASSLEHDLLHHRLHASALGRMAQWCVFASERVLTNQAQDVHRHSAKAQTRKLVSNLPLGKRSKSMSVLNSEWNCSCVAWSLYRSIMSCIVNLCGSVVVQPSNS